MIMEGEYPITKVQVQFYQENGYIQLPNVLSKEEVRDLRIILTRAVRERKKKFSSGKVTVDPNYERVFVQMVNMWEDYEEIRPYVFSHRLAEIARKLIRVRSVRLWHDHALIKPAMDGVETQWHQDFPYWPMNEPGPTSIWIALDNVNEENGCLCFLPKSHQYGKLKPVSLTQPDSVFKQVGLKPKDVNPEIMAMKAGWCTFHDGNTFHYAYGNTTTRPRRAFVIIYMPSGTTYNGAAHCVTDGLRLRIGEPLKGKKFPVLAGR
jgi:ectoine hydroxylase-related dioxygenase (phytanoyl-CoA dioxygenase family)